MRKGFLHTARLIAAALIILLVLACGQGQRALFAPGLDAPEPAAPIVQPEVAWPSSLPVDELQPWEETDGSGRIASSINLDSQFIPGVERFSEAGTVSDLGEASSFASGAQGAEAVSYALYRIPLGVEQPGTIAADVNLHAGGAYWLGVADYSADTWHWYGPFAAPHVRVALPHYEYTSTLGNLFIAVVAYDGASFDLVGLGVNARDDSDSTAPSVPEAPILTPVAGGLHVEWLPVVADDLAGYHVYADGVAALNYVEGGESVVVPASAETAITLTSIDLSGNESEPSEATTDTPLTGDIPAIQLTTSAASGGRNAVINLTASGADIYDWDVNGDGTYDITGDTSGTATASTASMGIIRPGLRGHTADGGFSLSAVSLIIAGNSRPVAAAYADPSSGYAPLDVSFMGEGEDDDGTIAEYAWDFDGDGIYDSTSQNPPPHTYSTPGLYNAKLRVTDGEGAWDVDTVAVQVLTAPDPDNVPPTADLQADVTSGNAPLTVAFDASGSEDADGSIVEYAWDWDGDGLYDAIGDEPISSHVFATAGSPEVKLRVTDDDWARATDTITITVNVVGNTAPTADISASPASGDAPLSVDFDAGLSNDPDGSIVRYDWDFNGDGYYELYDSVANPTWIYSTGGDYDARVRVTDDASAQDSDFTTISVSVPGNSDPVASLSPTSSSGDAPHTVEFDASESSDSDGSIVLYEWDFDGNGNYDGYGTDPTISHTYTAAGNYTARVRVTDDDGAQDTDTSSISVNAPPIASLEATPPEGEKSVTVYFDASASSDPDGSITDYEWDLDNDGVFNEAGAEAYAQGDSSVLVTYPNPGKYPVAVRVSDDASPAGTDTASVTVTVHGWVMITVDSAGDVGQYTSLAVVNGNPAISYYNVSNGDLKYARAATSTGGSASDWTQKVTVDSAGDVGQYTSLAVVDGCPAISYHSVTNFDLKYARAVTSTGGSASDWTQIVTVDSAGDVRGYYTSLAVVDGCPAISYFDATAADLKYARAVTSTGGSASDWTQKVTVDSDGHKGRYTSLAVVDGCPAISYRCGTDWDLRYARAVTSTGGSASDWTQKLTVDSAGYVGGHTSLAVVGGCPAISYWDETNGDLKYARAVTSTGGSSSDWTRVETVDSAIDVGYYTCLVVVNGYPAISYYDNNDGALKYAVLY